MPALVKKCRHSRGDWGECPCQWYADYRVAGQRTYKPLGRDRAQAQAAYRLAIANYANNSAAFADVQTAALNLRTTESNIAQSRVSVAQAHASLVATIGKEIE